MTFSSDRTRTFAMEENIEIVLLCMLLELVICDKLFLAHAELIMSTGECEQRQI